MILGAGQNEVLSAEEEEKKEEEENEGSWYDDEMD